MVYPPIYHVLKQQKPILREAFHQMGVLLGSRGVSRGVFPMGRRRLNVMIVSQKKLRI